jgi:triacylglycerol lipase
MAFRFDPTAADFSLTNALGSALASHLAYAGTGEWVATLRDLWGFEDVKIYASPPGVYDTNAFLAVRSDMVLVAFRGTEPRQIKDWLTDADVILVPTDLGHIHKGFWNAFQSVWPAMEADIRSIPRLPARSLWFTGHSLGAALSTLGVASSGAAGFPVAGHYNFGSPRVGDRSFANLYNDRHAAATFRFVNNNDIVPRVPPRELLYHHVDFRKYFDSHCTLVSDTRIVDLLLDGFAGSLLGLRNLFEQAADQQAKQLPLPDFLEDHRIDNYLACLRHQPGLGSP